jgi:hypothetical protein
MPGVDKDCVTHHYACECREQYFMDLEAALMQLVSEVEEADHWLRHTEAWDLAKALLEKNIKTQTMQ